MVKYVLNMY